MRPLPWVAMGLVVLILAVSARGYDLLANPAGWLLIGYGASRLALDPAGRARLLGVVWLAAAVSVVLWPGPVAQRLADADPSIAWAASLPQIAVAVVLCGELAGLARRARAIAAARWLDVARTVAVVAGVLPVLVFGGHLSALDAATDLVSVAAPVLLLALCLRYARRPWAAARDEVVEQTEPRSADVGDPPERA